ncbi:MAG: aminomethyl-transferring glycine dehydrogenase subunit GcvPB, partial [Desulfomonilia bacterium]|nr:aminomethyl-transferring glycine dehydrogenase subunit GcvPB [Desulfomonilia bacterium]
IRHFTRLSRLNFGIDQGMYPLGSCTMKHNPKISEEILSRFAAIHPADRCAMQIILSSIHTLAGFLQEICGMDACSVWPAAGAHGELTGMMIIKKAVKAGGRDRTTVLVPDTAHGTNPASCSIAGFITKNIPSGPEGFVTASLVQKHLDGDVAALMLTNPNTLGIFEQEISRIATILHENGSYLYMDGANLNAIMGISRPGDMGVDCMHVNLHKTFGAPHGGGGPGSGPVLVKKALERFLPVPRLERDSSGLFHLSPHYPDSIGMVHSTLGNVGVLIKALTYLLSVGPDGIRKAAATACLNANYLKKKLRETFDLPYDTPTLHEFVLSDRKQNDAGITTMDIAKMLMDAGFHPPTVHFPLVVPGALMIEPTETEPLSELQRFTDAMERIAEMCRSGPGSVRNRPQSTPVTRVDEVHAARNLVLTWKDAESIGPEQVSK